MRMKKCKQLATCMPQVFYKTDQFLSGMGRILRFSKLSENPFKNEQNSQ